MNGASIKTADIRIDGGTQSRVEINEAAVADYRLVLSGGGELPPVVVFHDGAAYWLADGFHRLFAHLAEDRATIPAVVRAGTKRDALLFSCGANTAHGLRRTNEDKRKAVGILLADAEWAAWSDRKIAEACGVGAPFVGDVRRSICNPITDAPAIRTVERGGRVYQQDTSKIGKIIRSPDKPSAGRHEPEPRPEDDGPSADEIAKAAAQVGAKPRKPAKAEPTAAQIEAEQIAEDAHGDFDPIAELESAQAEIADLRAQIKAAEADDQKAETLKWRRLYETAQRAASEKQDAAHRYQTELQRASGRLTRIGKLFGERDPAKIPALVEAFVRAHNATERAAA